MKNLEQTVNKIVDKALEGYKVMPPMNKDKYPEMPGLEGPFTLMSGKVVYYDPKEGAYYDKDTDMYMSYDEFRQHDNDYSNMKAEDLKLPAAASGLRTGTSFKKGAKASGPVSQATYNREMGALARSKTAVKPTKQIPMPGRGAVKEVDKSAIDAAVAQAMDDAPQTSLRPKARPKRMSRPKARPTINIGSNPETGATRGIDPRDNYSPEDLKQLLMQNEAQESVEDIIKRAMKDLKRIDPQVMFRTRDMMKAVATIKQGNIAGSLQDLVNGVDGPENQIQDVFNDTHDALQRLINPKTDKEVDDEYWADVDDMKARSRVGEEKTLQGVMSKVFDKAVQQVMGEGDGRKKGIHGKGHPMRKAQQAAIHANEGKMSDSIIDDSETMSKAEFTKKHGKEMADQYFESKLQDMRKALKLSESMDANTVVAQYTRATLDQTHNTWNKVCEQIDHIRSFVKEDIDIENVRIQIKKMHEQENLDYTIQIKENVDKLRQIVKDKSAMSIKFADGSMKVDMTTASIFLQVFDKVKEETQAKIVDKIQTKAGFLSMLELMYKKIG